MTETLVTPVLPVVRVAILAGNRMSEMALPAELPLREILPAVQRLVRGTDAADDDAPVRLSLAPIGGAPFSLEASLDTVGVVDGDLLALQPVPAGPAAPGIVEDVADAAVLFAESRRRPWSHAHIQLGARAAVIVAVLVLTGAGVAQRVITGSAIGLYAVSALAALTVVAALALRSRATRLAVELSIAAVVPVASAFALAVPGGFGAAQLVLGVAGVTAWSLIAMILGKEALAFFTATTVVGAGLLLAGGAAMLWQLPMLTLGAIALVTALLVTVQAAPLSAMWARLPLPVIPAPGDPAPAAPALRVLADLPQRVKIGEAHQRGFLAGAVVLSVLGSLAVVSGGSVPALAWYLVAATSLAAVLRARVWDTAACKAWLLAQPMLLLTGLLVMFSGQGRFGVALCVAIVLTVFVVAWVVVAGNPRLADPDGYSLPMRRLTGFLASGLDASLIPVMAYLVGLFSWVLDR